MTESHDIQIELRPWSAEDVSLLERLMGDPVMTEHLGGPEAPDKIRDRHVRYLALPARPGNNRMFVIVTGPDMVPVGSIGYWEKEWLGEQVLETGWSVLPEYQGRRIASTAAVLLIEQLRASGIHRSLHAFPSREHGSSNAVCRKAGFTLRGEYDFEYPPGNPLRSNDWAIDL